MRSAELGIACFFMTHDMADSEVSAMALIAEVRNICYYGSSVADGFAIVALLVVVL